MKIEHRQSNKLEEIFTRFWAFSVVAAACLSLASCGGGCDVEPTPTPSPTPTATPNPPECVVISAEVPDAHGAWVILGKPKEVIFGNYFGPDADVPRELKLVDHDGDGAPTLPRLVHYGDYFCKTRR
ncbi:MAG: hypothetical protein NZL96_02660 [Patescibacteria group bacterium]|nr:hypothetical protein [Patescibacteria group bacterium]